MFRKPFTPEELKAILDVLKEDPFIRPIIVTGMCTAMRRGDCCLLRWKDVDPGGALHHGENGKNRGDGQYPGVPDAV